MGQIKLIEFELSGQKYGVNMNHIKEIVRLTNITRIPNMKDYVTGVINLRGNIAFAIDLHRRLGLDSVNLNDRARIIIASKDENLFGFCVDLVSMVHLVDEENIEPPVASLAVLDNAFILGIAKMEDYLVTVLDLDRLMDTEELVLELSSEMYGC